MIIGFDLGGTKLSEALFSSDGEIIRHDIHMLNGRTGKEVGLLMGERLSVLLNEFENNIESIGVSVPGIYYRDSGMVWAPNIPGWESYPLLQELKEKTKDHIPVLIDSDRACYILGEVWQGSARGLSDVIFVAVGTGIGAGIMVNNEILRGGHDISGAIGWLALDRPYKKGYNDYGCFEYQASGSGIVRIVHEYLKMDQKYNGMLREIDPDNLSSKEVFAAYEQGDRMANRVINNAVELWGMAAANLVSLFDPQKIIFGGGVFGPASKLIHYIRQEAGKWAQPVSFKKVSIDVTSLKGNAGLYGTGKLALSALNNVSSR
ncbi:MAG TPA: ROK family protein [Balneolales bacterium]|nr:ROK family protein [Balneolales bacterium]